MDGLLGLRRWVRRMESADTTRAYVPVLVRGTGCLTPVPGAIISGSRSVRRKPSSRRGSHQPVGLPRQKRALRERCVNVAGALRNRLWSGDLGEERRGRLSVVILREQVGWVFPVAGCGLRDLPRIG
jgi:hypothetical protein